MRNLQKLEHYLRKQQEGTSVALGLSWRPMLAVPLSLRARKMAVQKWHVFCFVTHLVPCGEGESMVCFSLSTRTEAQGDGQGARAQDQFC